MTSCQPLVGHHTARPSNRSHRMRAMPQVTLTEEIGASGGGELSSKAEARRLAFYLFWNIKPYFDRCAALPRIP